MTDFTDLVETVLDAWDTDTNTDPQVAIDFIDRLERDGYTIIPTSTIGGLPPELVAKALSYLTGPLRSYVNFGNDWFTDDEIDALRAATFEVPT